MTGRLGTKSHFAACTYFGSGTGRASVPFISLIFLSRAFEPHTRATAVLVDELNAGGFQGAADRLDHLRRKTRSQFRSSAPSVQIKETQSDGKCLAAEIMRDVHQVGTRVDKSGDLIGISAAMQRFILADSQAREALDKLKKRRPLRPRQLSRRSGGGWKKRGQRSGRPESSRTSAAQSELSGSVTRAKPLPDAGSLAS